MKNHLSKVTKHFLSSKSLNIFLQINLKEKKKKNKEKSLIRKKEPKKELIKKEKRLYIFVYILYIYTLYII